MRFLSFTIKNFRGVQNARIDLIPQGAGVFTLIGLNESGKTTVLEAIGTFQLYGGDEKSLYQAKPSQVEPSTYVPKDAKATFTGDITVAAVIEFEDGDKASCIAWAEKEGTIKVDSDSVPDRITVTRGYRFKDGDLVEPIHDWSMILLGKEKGNRKFTPIAINHLAWRAFTAMVAAKLPEVVYFPTFLFEQPEKIVLNPQKGERPADRVYRKIIENVGASLERPINVTNNIVNRITSPETAGEIFSGLFSLSNNRQQQIESAISQMSHHLSHTVLNRWSKIFGGSTSDKEVRLKLGVDKHPDGEPRVYVQFSLRDGTQPYDISERSLGFRWFFSFLLFTLYRSTGSKGRKTLFLLDEPASNLHAGAQTQLLESFPKIATAGSLIMYSTHSHYLINPEWLDQALIISNDAVDYDDLKAGMYGGHRTSHVTAERYRSFVGSNPDKTTYFQPVLDRLKVVPSRLDALKPSVLVEGKGDYLILAYGLWLADIAGAYAVIPTRGADHFDELVSILLGWGVNFALCCDDDTPGRKAVTEYTQNWGLPVDKAFTLAKLDPQLSGKTIEGFLDPQDIDLVKQHFGLVEAPSKSQIQLFFSEKLASASRIEVSDGFKAKIVNFDRAVREALTIN
ncbi:AAA family ATPase [Sphingomonas endolithica]|uniref:AAA family ATPase n=1 Tax=Sphingomonas endolithica TaxID=2972485 RepID=UPI0021AE528A|nr:ATP-binding protein [Sphingomonas sp. ZFBP2030]